MIVVGRASFQGYRHTNAYIVTQWPLKSTVNDIWRLVYDYNIPTLVLLNEGSCSRVSSHPRTYMHTLLHARTPTRTRKHTHTQTNMVYSRPSGRRKSCLSASLVWIGEAASLNSSGY